MNEQIEAVPVIRLDLGCGPNKRPDHVGIDIHPFDGVEVIMDIGRDRLPYEDGSVESVHCSHALEHLPMEGRCHLLNEIWRVLRLGGQAQIITPHWANERAYGDPTHIMPPVVGFFYLYANRAWREANAPHVSGMLSCNFDNTPGVSWAPDDAYITFANQEARVTRLSRNINSAADNFANLVKLA